MLAARAARQAAQHQQAKLQRRRSPLRPTQFEVERLRSRPGQVEDLLGPSPIAGLDDDRDDSEPLTLADNDVFAGLRVVLNNVQDSELLAGIAYDPDSGETFINVEADRCIGEASVLTLSVRIFSSVEATDKSYQLMDDYLQLRQSNYY